VDLDREPQSQGNDGSRCGHKHGRDASLAGARLIGSFLGSGHLRLSKHRNSTPIVGVGTYQSAMGTPARYQYRIEPKPSNAQYTRELAFSWAVYTSLGLARGTRI